MGLSEAPRVRAIVIVRPVADHGLALPDPFLLDDGSAHVVLAEGESVAPRGWAEFERDLDDDIGLAARVQGPEPRDAATEVLHRLLEAPARVGDLAEEPEGVKQVRLAAGVGADDEGAVAQGDVDVAEVPPVLCRQM